jgi:hypothetical protein
MANVASTYMNQGRLDEAEKLQMDVMSARKTKLGSNHSDTLTSMAHLASTYQNQGGWDEAEKLTSDMYVMNARKTQLGSQHPDNLTIMADSALTYWNQGRLDEAEKLGINFAKTVKHDSGHMDAILTSVTNQPPSSSNQVLQTVQQDHDQPENMVHKLSKLTLAFKYLITSSTSQCPLTS